MTLAGQKAALQPDPDASRQAVHILQS
jgi:hypothetical protein